MKNKIVIAIMSIFLAAGLSSCDLFDKVDDVSFSSEVEKSIVINDAPAGSYSDEVVLNVTDDSEVAKYSEKITGIIVNNITYRVSDYSGPSGATFTGDMLFGPSGSLGSVAINGLNLSTASGSGEEFALDLSQSEVDAIAEQLKVNKTLVVIMAGTFSDGPVSLVIHVKIDATIEADAL